MHQAARVIFGRTELRVSPVCYGSWQASPVFWGTQSKEHLNNAMRHAFDRGINFFDTADAYGDGRAETILGEALHGLPRDNLVLCSKVGHHFYPDGKRHPDLSGDYLRRACDATLRRMQTDYLDIYLLHLPTPLLDPSDTTSALDSLKQQGKIRHYGLSNFTVEQFRMMRSFGDYAVCQPEYNLLDNEAEQELLPYCQAENIGVMVYSPLARGLLTGKYAGNETFSDHRADIPRFQGKSFGILCEKVGHLRRIAETNDLTIPQLILAATRMHPAVHCTIVGVKTSEQIEEAAGAMNNVLSVEDYYTVRAMLAGEPT